MTQLGFKKTPSSLKICITANLCQVNRVFGNITMPLNKRIAESGEVGLVLEDDAIFFPDLLQRCQDLLHSIEQHGDTLFYINAEYAIDDVPIYYWRHRLVKMDGTKKTGAYLLSPQAAQKLAAHLDDALQNQQTINLPADWWITQKHQQIGINTYWAVHPLVWQGSKTGRFASDLSLRQFSVFYGVYEKIQRHFMPTFNKIRACFRKKIRQRVHYPVNDIFRLPESIFAVKMAIFTF